MASAPQTQSLPLFYNDLIPLSSVDHASYKGRAMENLAVMANTHAMPLTVEEFIVAQRHLPIVFSAGEEPLPLALFGLNEGVNMFMDENNDLRPDAYLPAYMRRYPFMLVRLQPDREDLSLCFDPTSGLLGDFEEGTPLFVDGQPSEETKSTLAFCEQFEIGVQKTVNFMAELKEYDLLMDGEITIEQQGVSQPFIYRGFRMVDEAKLRDLRGDQLRKMMQSGMLPLVHAHLFSLQHMPTLFQRQFEAGKVQANG
ncbi:SapC family protein [Sphingomonas sp. BIUV-7]|uniref:SapC family protein n=1 Tax=Sphingomonas natans TaxID=3063330 RepID=A0ABT8Y5Z8_9SPHN|nr:SapC family protein [Sphingomonas sp. BIUV-7]MDO6413749.1 SapC family protein [Sphingomonas sp. BIUV-7]